MIFESKTDRAIFLTSEGDITIEVVDQDENSIKVALLDIIEEFIEIENTETKTENDKNESTANRQKLIGILKQGVYKLENIPSRLS